MKKSPIKKSIAVVKGQLDKSIKRVSKNNNKVNFSKEEFILNKLESTLGKPKDEVKSMISEGLLAILTKVPFSVN